MAAATEAKLPPAIKMEQSVTLFISYSLSPGALLLAEDVPMTLQASNTAVNATMDCIFLSTIIME
jgi:hypothetical protein